jgi:hypothetical protein
VLVDSHECSPGKNTQEYQGDYEEAEVGVDDVAHAHILALGYGHPPHIDHRVVTSTLVVVLIECSSNMAVAIITIHTHKELNICIVRLRLLRR